MVHTAFILRASLKINILSQYRIACEKWFLTYQACVYQHFLFVPDLVCNPEFLDIPLRISCVALRVHQYDLFTQRPLVNQAR